MKQLKAKYCQKGAALVIGLVLLFVLTLLGVSSLSSTTLDLKVVGNSQQQSLAYNAAEAALRQAETFLQNNILNSTSIANFSATVGHYALTTPPDFSATLTPTQSGLTDYYDDADWTNANSIVYVLNANTYPRSPRYIIEYLGRATEAPFNPNDPFEAQFEDFSFRITAIGWGGDQTSKRVLTSYYIHREQ